MEKREEGITLVALMITIIILIILATVTILTVTNHNIVGKASSGTEEYAKGQQYELGEIDNVAKILGDFENKISGGTGTEGLDKTPIDKETSYVGYYADIDSDGEVDGIIYADLAKGNTGSGEWGINEEYQCVKGSYTIPIEENLKEYYVSKTEYEGPFGVKDVLSPKGTGNDRFYVMSLANLKGCCWYNEAYKNGMTDYEEATSESFGTGKANTATMIAKWDTKAYGEQDTYGIYFDTDEGEYIKDIWGQIKNEVSRGWFVPSKGEWAAFGGELKITKDEWLGLPLGYFYWTSSVRNSKYAWYMNGYYTGFGYNTLDDYVLGVRLSITF